MAAESVALTIDFDNALVAAELAPAREQLGDILSRGTPENTRRAYEADWRYVTSWHELRLLTKIELPLSTDTVLLFITDHLQGLPERVESALVGAGRKRPGVLEGRKLVMPSGGPQRRPQGLRHRRPNRLGQSQDGDEGGPQDADK